MTQENYQEISPLGKDIDPYVSLGDKLTEDADFAAEQRRNAEDVEAAIIKAAKEKQAQQNNGDNG